MGVRPNFLPDGRFWYQALTSERTRSTVLVNPADGSRTVKANLNEFRRYGSDAGRKNQGRNPNEVMSPDGKKAAFIRNWNLWMRDIATGKETQLTTDGVENYGYATDNAGWKHSDRAILLWSPDSRKIATFQQDQRKTAKCIWSRQMSALRSLKSGNIRCRAINDRKTNRTRDNRSRYAESHPPENAARSASFDAMRRYFVRRSLTTTNGALTFATRVCFDLARSQTGEFRVADAATGEVKEIYEEKVATQYESGQGAVNWRFLPGTNEFIWYSERDDWGHLYLYDLRPEN